MTTENIAVLFCDVVGSTELSQRLSVDAADELRRDYFSILRQAVAEAGGTEVKNLGDGIMVVFATASAALSCAVGMQQGIEHDNRRREYAVGLRVGLSGGEVVKEDGDYFGDPVVEAARLCAVCASGQVLAADVVRLTAGRRSRHECRPLGKLTLKGLSDPVATVEVAWEPISAAEAAAVPLPGRLAVVPSVGVIGRELEIVALSDACKRVAAGGGREVVLVSGEAGLGKTTLVADTARRAFEAGACVLFGHCEEDLATPYQLFAEALGHFVTHAPEDQLAAHVAAHGSELVPLVPALASRIPNLPSSKATDSDTERFLLFAAVVSLLAAASEHQPIVVVLDDLQWADAASLVLLRHLTAHEQPMRVLVLGTFRDSELAHADALRETLGLLRRHDRVSRIELDGFDDAGVMALMEATAGHRLEGAAVGLAHAVFQETDGNPFFVSEVLRHLAETGAISQDASGQWTADVSLEQLALPDSVREVIGGRVVRLGKVAERVLSIGAVIGRDFDLDLLARATKTSEDELLDVLDAAAAVALVREADMGRYSFAHALVQHTLYEDLGPNRRARAHRQVAEALEEICGDRPGARVGELARHFFSATQPVELTKAIRYSRLAGDGALAALAPADALRYYAQALDLHPKATDPDPILEVDLAIGLGTAQRQTGDPTYRQTLLDAARRAAELGDTDRLVAAALANNRGWFTSATTIDADKIEILELALERVPAEQPDRALVLAALCMELTWDSPVERRQALSDEALAIAVASGDDTTIVRVLNNFCSALNAPQLLEQSLARTADALTRAERIGDPVLYFFAADWRAIAAVRAGDIDEMDRCLETVGLLANQLDQPFLNWAYATDRAMRALIAGNTDQAEELATEAFRIGTEGGEPDAGVVFALQQGIVSLQRGAMGDLIPIIEEMATETSALAAGQIGAFLALAHAEGDDVDGAGLQLEQFAATGFELPIDDVWLLAMVSYADAAIVCRDPQYAQPLSDRLAPYAAQWTVTGSSSQGSVSHYLGGLATVLGRYQDADAYFTRAAELNNRIGAKFDTARTDLLWANMRTKRNATGDLAAARDLFANACTAAHTYGYATVERRANQGLQLLA